MALLRFRISYLTKTISLFPAVEMWYDIGLRIKVSGSTYKLLTYIMKVLLDEGGPEDADPL